MSGVDVPPEYNHIMSKLYHCIYCFMNKNQLVDMKAIYDELEKIPKKSFPKKAREFFIFIALKKRDRNDFAFKECFNLYKKAFLQCLQIILHRETSSKNLNEPAFNGKEFKNKIPFDLSFKKTDKIKNPGEIKNKELFCQQIFSDFKYSNYKINSSQSENTVGIFWDIENCQLGRNRSAKKFINYIKNKFEKRLKVKEFVVVICCNFENQSRDVIEQLFRINRVKLINHTGGVRNAADNILIEEMTDFTRSKKYPHSLTHIVVISGDKDFCTGLESLKAQGYLVYNIHPQTS